MISKKYYKKILKNLDINSQLNSIDKDIIIYGKKNLLKAFSNPKIKAFISNIRTTKKEKINGIEIINFYGINLQNPIIICQNKDITRIKEALMLHCDKEIEILPILKDLEEEFLKLYFEDKKLLKKWQNKDIVLFPDSKEFRFLEKEFNLKNKLNYKIFDSIEELKGEKEIVLSQFNSLNTMEQLHKQGIKTKSFFNKNLTEIIQEIWQQA